jgi:hypothetical protein
MSKRSKNGVNQLTTSRAYQEDTDKNDQGWAFLAGSSTPLEPDEDGPAIKAVAAPAAGEDSGAYKTPSK